MANQLESISNEILLQIMEYLDVHTLFVAFYGLNHRFNALLRSCHLHFLVGKAEYDEKLWNRLTSFFKTSQIWSLSFYDNVGIKTRYMSAMCRNVRSPVFCQNNQSSIIDMLEHISVTNCIRSLSIDDCYCNCSETSSVGSLVNFILTKHGHRFTSLVSCSLKLMNYTTDFPIVSFNFYHLRRLALDHCQWTPNILLLLRENTPNLRTLCMNIGYYPSRDLSSWKDVFKHIRELDIRYEWNPSNFEICLAMFPCLRRLHIQWGNTRQSAVIDGTRWQIIIETQLPYIQQLTLDFDDNGIGEDIMKTFYTGEFWSRKKVVVKMIANKSRSQYRQVKTIYFGQQWRF